MEHRSLPNRHLQYLLGLLALGFLNHGIVLLTRSAVGDSIYCNEWMLESRPDYFQAYFQEVGVPQLTFWFRIFCYVPDPLFVHRVIGLVCAIGIAIGLYFILIRWFHPLEAFWVAACAITYPAFSLWGECAVSQYYLFYMIYVFAWFIELYWSSKSLLKRLILFGVFFLTGNYAGLLVFHYIASAWYVLRSSQTQANIFTRAWNVVQEYPHLIFAPGLFYLLKNLYSPPNGAYSDYNHPHLSTGMIPDLFSLVSEVLLGVAREVSSMLPPPWLTLVLLAVFVLCAQQRWPTNKSESKSLSGVWVETRTLGLISIVSILSIALPYIMVNRYFFITGWDSRNCLLLCPAVGMLILVLFRICGSLLQIHPLYFMTSMGSMVLVLFTCSNLETHLARQAEHVKQLAVIQALNDDINFPKANFIEIEDEFDIPGASEMLPAICWTNLVTEPGHPARKFVIQTQDGMIPQCSSLGRGISPIVTLQSMSETYSSFDIETLMEMTTLARTLKSIPSEGKQLVVRITPSHWGGSPFWLDLRYYQYRYLQPAGYRDFLKSIATVRIRARGDY